MIIKLDITDSPLAVTKDNLPTETDPNGTTMDIGKVDYLGTNRPIMVVKDTNVIYLVERGDLVRVTLDDSQASSLYPPSP